MHATHQAGRPVRYRLTDLIGKGGFAHVYRAQAVDWPEAEDVAIKILHDAQPPDEVLRRFRDESRILQLAQDPSLVRVAPARRMGGRWAVVMEYVPGADCRALIEHYGGMPARVAVEIVRDVAAALDRVHRLPGPDGEPLLLVHRDIKPGNIQITQHGAVKLLDFGVARAQFASRETKTTRAIQGTYGYIAPERLLGLDTPAGDIFSLGMVLYKLVTGGPTDRKVLHEAAAATRGAEGHALALAIEMCSPEHEDRPSPGAVVARTQALLDRMEGPRLAAWAWQHVPHEVGTSDDPLVGTVLEADPDHPEPTPAPPQRRSRHLWVALRRAWPTLSLGVLGLLLVGVVTAAWMVAGGLVVELLPSSAAAEGLVPTAPGAP